MCRTLALSTAAGALYFISSLVRMVHLSQLHLMTHKYFRVLYVLYDMSFPVNELITKNIKIVDICGKRISSFIMLLR